MLQISIVLAKRRRNTKKEKGCAFTGTPFFVETPMRFRFDSDNMRDKTEDKKRARLKRALF